jgi:hypothetical protein
MPEAFVSIQAAIYIYNRLIAAPGATTPMFCEVANALTTLGDELGQGGTASLNDLGEALSAYRKGLSLLDQTVSIDPDSMCAKHGIAVAQMKIGDAEPSYGIT